jgi:tRNA A37 threonylcarbamoyladenosine synthetase subunit TsaC/SUA5/YrdC
MMSSTLLLPDDDAPMTSAREIETRLSHAVDAIIDGGNCGLAPTSVIDLVGDVPVVVRDGRGDVSAFTV